MNRFKIWIVRFARVLMVICFFYLSYMALNSGNVWISLGVPALAIFFTVICFYDVDESIILRMITDDWSQRMVCEMMCEFEDRVINDMMEERLKKLGVHGK